MRVYLHFLFQVEASIIAVSKLCRKHRLKPPSSPGKAAPIPAAVLRSRISELSGGYSCNDDVCVTDDEIASRYCSSDIKGGSSQYSPGEDWSDEDWSDEDYDDIDVEADESDVVDEYDDDDDSEENCEGGE